MEELRNKIESILSHYTGRWGIVIMNQTTGEKMELNPDMAFPAASMIKVPIMVEIMRQAAAGLLSLDQKLVIDSAAKVDGAGILKELRPGLTMTVRELVTLMIILSDNTATNILIDLVGMEAVNQTMSNLGLQSTVLRRRMMDFAEARSGKENMTSAADLAHLFAGIASGSLGLPPAYSAIMLDILKRQQIRDKLPFYWPEELVIAHKTGTLPGAEHDGGILYLPGGPYVVCVLAAGLKENYLGLQMVASIGKCLYDHIS
ncbi:serine hydrolase [Sporomusa aerivorans]|uniref:serine hydrolase n=1 Tax=Sporomusa aerivorans TaxID=204936 RepID=UPI00352B1D9D